MKIPFSSCNSCSLCILLGAPNSKKSSMLYCCSFSSFTERTALFQLCSSSISLIYWKRMDSGLRVILRSFFVLGRGLSRSIMLTEDLREREERMLLALWTISNGLSLSSGWPHSIYINKIISTALRSPSLMSTAVLFIFVYCQPLELAFDQYVLIITKGEHCLVVRRLIQIGVGYNRMSEAVENELIRLEKKYLERAITNCLPCYELNYKQPCMAQCSLQYVKFMSLREFYLAQHRQQLKVTDLREIEKAVDSL